MITSFFGWRHDLAKPAILSDPSETQALQAP